LLLQHGALASPVGIVRAKQSPLIHVS